jgi:hypothetical protein
MATTNHADHAEEEWVASERAKVVDYLSQQACQHAGVGEWPAFHVDPYLAIWAVQSSKSEGSIGWWAISGDAPTDYMTRGSAYHPREAMRHFGSEWSEICDAMAGGRRRDGYMIGSPDEWPSLEPLLRSRAGMLLRWADDDEIWEE